MTPTQEPTTGRGRFLSNIHNPDDPNARMYHVWSHEAYYDQQIADREWRTYLEWVNENVIGPPEATEIETVEQLQCRGVVGIYAPV